MIVEFDRSFIKALDRIKNKKLLAKVENLTLTLEKANAIENISNGKKLTGYANYYRIRIGDYRIGVEKLDSKTIKIITIAHRNEIYKNFP